MDKVVINPKEKGLNIKIYSENEIKQIGGHRFVALLGENPRYENAFTIILGFLGLKPFKDNVFAQVGRDFENKILDKVWGEGTYKSFEWDEDNRGDMFPNIEGFNGLIDGLHNEENKIAEVKCYFSRKKLPQAFYDSKKKRSIRKLIDPYYLQARLYLWLLNYNDSNCGIDTAEVITCFFPSATEPEIQDKFIDKFIVKHTEDDGFHKLVEKALQHKKQLMVPHKDKDGNTYYECNVLYGDVTKNTLKLLKEVNDGLIPGKPVEIIWENK